jgi:predicted MFS family arabinose efflux permease
VLTPRFGILWSGQIATLIGNSILWFAFVVHAWESGEQASQVVWLSLASMLPKMLLSPVAGAIVDRCSKRTALQLADLAGLVAVGGLTAVYFSGHLELWEIYAGLALGGAAIAFADPALLSAVPVLVRKDQFQRANGMLATANSVANVCGPAIAGFLIASVGLGAILWADLATFVVAIVTVRAAIPADSGGSRPAGRPEHGLLADSLAGLRYIFARPSLRGLVLVFFAVNLTMVFGFAVLPPMILAASGNDSAALASVMTSIGIGGIAGGLILAAHGGPKNRLRGMMLSVIGMCLTAEVAIALSRSLIWWCAAIFVGALLMPIINGTMQAIIQTKVPVGQQGRVFGAVIFFAEISAPLAMIFAGPLADHVFQPEGLSGSGLVGLLAPLVGGGRGGGLAAMLLIAGIGGIGASVWGLASRPVRDIDVLLPDLGAELSDETAVSDETAEGVTA